MFGAFKPTSPLSVGLLWKTPWRMSAPRKLRHRRRLRRVDNVIAVLDSALQRRHNNLQTSSLSSQASINTGSTSTSTSPSVAAQLLRSGRGPKRGALLPPYPLETDKGLVGEVRTTNSVARERGTIKVLERWKADMPREEEMVPRDKYTMFARYEKKYRKSVHKSPKFTRVSQRLNPPGF